MTGNVSSSGGRGQRRAFTFTVAGLGSVTSGTVTNGTASAAPARRATAQSYAVTTAYSGHGVFAASSVATGSLTVNPAAQTITFSALAARTALDADFTLATSSSGLPVTYTATGNATVTGNSVHITGAGVPPRSPPTVPATAIISRRPTSQSFTIKPKALTATITADNKVYNDHRRRR